jgi:hypothetical protein
MVLPVLLVLLAAAMSLAVGLAAYIVARACGASLLRALSCAAASFLAAFTLGLLALTFVESASQGHPASGHSAPTVSTFVMMKPTNSVSTAFKVTHHE